jgi:hypothetical protein
MPRSYGFDHFTVPKSGQPRPPRGKKPQERAVRGSKRKASTLPPHEAPAGQATVHAQAAQPAAGVTAHGHAEAPRPARDAGAGRRHGIRDAWTLAGEHARVLRDGAEQVLRAGRELARLPLNLVRALRGAAHEG